PRVCSIYKISFSQFTNNASLSIPSTSMVRTADGVPLGPNGSKERIARAAFSSNSAKFRPCTRNARSAVCSISSKLIATSRTDRQECQRRSSGIGSNAGCMALRRFTTDSRSFSLLSSKSLNSRWSVCEISLSSARCLSPRISDKSSHSSMVNVSSIIPPMVLARRWQIAGPCVRSNQPFLSYAPPHGEILAMIFFSRFVIQWHVHAILAHVPGNGPLLLDIRDVKSEVGHAMAERRLQILSNRIASVNRWVVWWKVNGVGGIGRNYFVQLPCIPMASPIIADLADHASRIDGFGLGNRVVPFGSSALGALLCSPLHGNPPSSPFRHSLKQTQAARGIEAALRSSSDRTSSSLIWLKS